MMYLLVQELLFFFLPPPPSLLLFPSTPLHLVHPVAGATISHKVAVLSRGSPLVGGGVRGGGRGERGLGLQLELGREGKARWMDGS